MAIASIFATRGCYWTRFHQNLMSRSISFYKKEVLAEEISKEINAQLDSFENLMDSKPDFIDGHHHIHQLSLKNHNCFHPHLEPLQYYLAHSNIQPETFLLER